MYVHVSTCVMTFVEGVKLSFETTLIVMNILLHNFRRHQHGNCCPSVLPVFG